MNPLLAFVIPLKSARSARRWDTVVRLYHDCLRSLSRQTDGRYLVVTVCHELPPDAVPLPRHAVVTVDSPAPPFPGDRDLRDRWLKMARGLEEARRQGATHVMFVDADDLVSNRLAAWVAAHPDENGWIFREGYHYRHRTGRLKRWRSFDRFCGTSAILRMDRLEAALRGPGDEVDRLRWLCWHRHLAERMESRGFPLRPLPFPGSVYVFAGWENQSYFRRHYWLWGWKRWLLARPRTVALTPERIGEFSLPDPARTSKGPNRWTRESRRESDGGVPASSPSR